MRLPLLMILPHHIRLPHHKPPVITCESIKLSDDENLLLSKNPKYAIRKMLNRETYLVEFEKSMIKEKFGRIGKDEVDGKVVIDLDDDKVTLEMAEWLEMKSRLVYDFEDNNMDLGRCKATDWKTNKRITLPKSGSAKLEAYMEVRRAEANKLFGSCEDDKEVIENLSVGERKAVKTLQKRAENGELQVCQTDKSGRFAVLTRQQYLEAGEALIKNDREIDLEENS